MTRLAIFALPLFIFLPSQAYAQSHRTQEGASSQKPTSTTLPIVEQRNESPALQPEHKEQVNADVRIIQAPEKDAFDIATLIVNVVLAGVGIFGIIYARKTLRQISLQTTRLGEHAEHFSSLATAAKDNANAALRQTEHTETTERAWLLISFISMKDRELKDGEVATCHWAIKNVGSTPGILLETKTRFHLVRLYDEMPEDPVKALPAIPDYGSPIAINERLLAPQDSIGYFTRWERNTDGNFSEFAFRTNTNEVWMVVAYGYVKYRDIFGKERESRSCDFTCIGRSDNIPLEFRPHPRVPAAYNRCT